MEVSLRKAAADAAVMSLKCCRLLWLFLVTNLECYAVVNLLLCWFKQVVYGLDSRIFNVLKMSSGTLNPTHSLTAIDCCQQVATKVCAEGIQCNFLELKKRLISTSSRDCSIV